MVKPIARIAAVIALALPCISFAVESKPQKPSPQSLKGEIQRQLASSSFENLLSSWQTRYGTQAVVPLIHVASDRAIPDQHRYVAVMGAAKLGGQEGARLIAPLLKDSSWMVRSGALRALSALKNTETSAAVLPLLKDKALVVRLEAVEAVQKLQPKGAAEALLAAASDPANYRNGKAQWVPVRALAALRTMKTEQLKPKLRELLSAQKDPAVRTEITKILATSK